MVTKLITNDSPKLVTKIVNFDIIVTNGGVTASEVFSYR